MCVKALAKPMKKSVRWSTVTVYEFDVAIGGSSVPRHGGPSVGLAKTPTCVWSTPLDAHTDQEDEAEECVIHLEEEPTTHRPVADDQPQLHSRAAAKICERQQRRRCRVRWLKPFERVTMLTQAGLSERRIYRMMKECAAIFGLIISSSLWMEQVRACIFDSWLSASAAWERPWSVVMSLYTLRQLLSDCSTRTSRTKCAVDKKHETLGEIWRALNDWIDSRFNTGKGVHIATFATISWETCTNSRNQAKLRAVFLLSDTFIKTYNLQQKKPLTPPLLSSCEDINFTKIAIKFSKNLTKDLVFCGVRDLLQKIGEIAASGAPMSIAFNCGRLIAKNRCISMIFDPLRFPRALEDEITRSMVGSPPSALGNLTDFDIAPEDQVELNLPTGRRESNGDAEQQQQQQFSFETDGREAQPTNRSNPENLIPFEVSLEEELEMFGIIGSPGKGNPVMESAYKRHIASLAEDVDREAKYAFDLQLQQKRDLDTVALENRMRRLCAEDLQRQILVQMDERHHEKRQEKGTLRALDPSVCSFYCDGEQTRLGFDDRAYIQRNKQELKQHLQEQMQLKAMDRTDARQRHLADDTMLLRRIRHEMDELDQKNAQKREDSCRVLTQAWHHDKTVKKLVETKKKQRVAEQIHKEGVAISPMRVNYYPNLPQPITPRLRRSSDDGDYSVGFDIRSVCGD